VLELILEFRSGVRSPADSGRGYGPGSNQHSANPIADPTGIKNIHFRQVGDMGLAYTQRTLNSSSFGRLYPA
jgi:hypothetical protein